MMTSKSFDYFENPQKLGFTDLTYESDRLLLYLTSRPT